jgi:hypothetical protein
MKTELQKIREEAWRIVLEPRASRVERLEALKLIAACKGVLLPDIDERWLSAKQVCQLREAKRALLEKALQRREQRRRANRKHYLRRTIAALEQAAKEEQENHDTQTN